MSNPTEIGTKLVALCQQGKNLEAIEQLYAPNVVSVEAAAAPGFDQVVAGKEAVLAKSKFWSENTEVHSAETVGPFPHGDDRFAVIFRIDATMKPTGQRQKLEEIAVYQLKDDKIVREEFYFSTPAG
jgi:ketosteroid isomerase-like protein